MEMENAPWLKFYKNTPHMIDYPDITMYSLVEKAKNKYPSFPAYEFMDRITTYSEFFIKIDLVARALSSIGIKTGDKVTIALPNCPQALDAFYAVNRIGAISNMVHPLSAPGEIEFCLNLSKSKAIFILDRFYYKVAQIKSRLENPVEVIIVHISDELSPLKGVLYSLTQERKYKTKPTEDIIEWAEFLSCGKGYLSPLPPVKETSYEGASILYSGGTTGTTKGILLSDRNFNALALQTGAASGYADLSGKTMLSIMPVFHGFGLGIGIHTALAHGCKCILVPRFSIKIYSKLLRAKKPNFIPGVPTLFEALLRAKDLSGVDLSFLMGVFCGGDTLTSELKEKVDKFLSEHNSPVPIREGYGTTECVTASCLTPIDSYRKGSIGIPFPDTYYSIVTPGTVNELPAGKEGEICISGPSVMIKYLDNDEETNNTLRLHADGRLWLHTGDLGKMDEDGFVYFIQRIKRMIISSGYSIYPSRLENIIDGHEKVSYSCVIGVPDEYKKQKVKAFIVLKPDVKPDETLKADILEYCAQRIAKYALPYDIEFREELPKTLVGKVAYRVLEEEESAKLSSPSDK